MLRIMSELNELADPDKAKILSKFFKTGKGDYGEGDQFLGIKVPEVRKISRKYTDIDFGTIQQMLNNNIHEYRLAAILILVEKYRKSDERMKSEVFDFYLRNSKKINNWDLVDGSAEKIIGPYLMDKNKDIIYRLARSNNLWERRIAILSTFHFIKNRKFQETFKVAEILLKDEHDLIQKAVGWMLREIGKRDQDEEEKFLMKHYKKMPRTMLRYAIEKFTKKKRDFYLGRIEN